MEKIVAMIPARLGSKRIKNKNLRLLDGKPLIYYVVKAAKETGLFSEVYINSEAEIFSKIALEYGVNFYKRSKELASDTATNDMFVLDFINHIGCDIIVQINPTSPLISSEDVADFVKNMLLNKYDTLHSVKEEQIEGLFKNQALNFNPLKEMPRSQDLEPVKLFCSGIMGWRVAKYRENMEKFGAATYGGDGKTGYFPLQGFATIDIDNEIDFQLAEIAIFYKKNAGLFKTSYYDSNEKTFREEKDVLDILRKDGVFDNELDDSNKVIANINRIIANQDNNQSWSRRIINTENNSATLISQLPGEGNRLHYHYNWNEWWYIIEGEWVFEIEGEKSIVKKGDIVFIEKNKWHRITACGKTPAVRLAVSKDMVPHVYKEFNDISTEK